MTKGHHADQTLEDLEECKCGHIRDRHVGAGGLCREDGCSCPVFELYDPDLLRADLLRALRAALKKERRR